MLDPQVCYKALLTRDERFDGRFFVGVVSTGVYCRPICPARPPKPPNCRFFLSAAAAQEAGFRPCLRCRPDAGPELACSRGTSNTVTRALTLIAEGKLDGAGASIDALADRLGLGARHVRRLFQRHVGASPVAVAQTRRVLFAKQLVHETRLPMAEIALAAGFGSVRRFNETFRGLFGRPPSALRRDARGDEPFAAAGVTLRLPYRPPYDWNAILAYLAARAIDGIERVEGGAYRRTVLLDGAAGAVIVGHDERARALVATVRFPNVRALPAVIARIKRVFDLGADVQAIGTHLARDAWLAPLVAARPGLRVPGGWDGFEVAVRAVLGQQVSLAAARGLGTRLAETAGAPLSTAAAGRDGLRRAFPTADEIVRADLGRLGIPIVRARALRALAQAALRDANVFRSLATIEETVARLRLVLGVGDWTANVIALRAAGEPDAFPASDRALSRAVAACGATPLGTAALRARAERWRPWRGYAAQHLWAADATARRPCVPSARAVVTVPASAMPHGETAPIEEETRP